ncbi:MAG: hypothetical protein IT370_24635 [Deltaproteobacteria bacterium]|nr:hypothetical protein [Deltaproteobacteria bacterium]
MAPSTVVSSSLLTFLLLALAGSAAAETRALGVVADGPPGSAQTRSIFTVELQASIGGPLGVIGASASVAPTRWLDLAVGVGAAVDGLQAAASVRWHQDKPGSRRYVAATVSQGGYVDEDLFSSDERRFDSARWVSVEVGNESGDRGMFSRWGLGLTKMVSAERCMADIGGGGVALPCDVPLDGSYLYPYFSLSVGYRY